MRHHLAILQSQYVAAILAGRKTVECRLGRPGHPPHGLVRPGDLIWLKEVSGPVRAAVRADAVRSFRLAQEGVLARIRREFGARIGAPAEFWQAGEMAGAVTLVMLGDLVTFQPFRVRKTDRRAWVPLNRPPAPGRPLR